MTRNSSMIRFGITLTTVITLAAGCGGDLQSILDDVEGGSSQGAGGAGTAGNGGATGPVKCEAGMQPSGVPCQVCRDPAGVITDNYCAPFPGEGGMGGDPGAGGVTGMGGDPGMGGFTGTGGDTGMGGVTGVGGDTGMGGSAGPLEPHCDVKMTGTGTACKVCYDEMGAIVANECGDGASMGPTPGLTCVVEMDRAGGTCTACFDDKGQAVKTDCSSMTVLVPPALSCRTEMTSSGPCKVCFDATGAIVANDCAR
jgi:hypothetical protein